MDYNKAIETIMRSKNIYLASHVNPDGDNLGSTIGLYLALKKIKKNVKIIKTDKVPDYLKFLPYINEVKYEAIDEIDLLITLDCGDISRLGKFESLKDRHGIKILNIDHHFSNNDFGDVNLVDREASSTCELVYKFIKEMDIEIDNNIASLLYVGISTDTGSFMYDNTSSETHRIIAELIDFGIDINYINNKLYQSKTMNEAKLFIEAIGGLELYFNNRLGIVTIDEEILRNTGSSLDDSEGIVEFIRSIEDIEVAILLKSIDSENTKISSRSKSYIDVSKIMKSLGGGGHVRAAGANVNLGIEATKDILIKLFNEVL